MYAAANAVEHLRLAWKIRHLDPAMALFRGITADEESVTSIFHALKARKYVGADQLRVRRHDHKAAGVPFLAAVEGALVGMMPLRPTLVFKRPSGPAPRIRLRLHLTGLDGIPYQAEHEPPLHGSLSLNGSPVDFSNELNMLASLQQAKDIQTHIHALANERNRLLYASPNGIPSVTLTDQYFLMIRRRVFRNLGIYLLIMEYKEHQAFVQQALDAFWAVLSTLRGGKATQSAPAV
jgi:hypothetical protein